MINANLVNHTKFPQKKLMELFLGVCKALKTMHNYRVRGEPAGVNIQKRAKTVRAGTAMNGAKVQEVNGRGLDQDSEQQEPLMDGEVITSQEGVAPGEMRAYAHRDIKPG